MADDKDELKVVLEREYNVPLRRGWLKAPKYKRSKKAVTTLREFLQRHMKSDDIKLGAHVNEHIWSRGIRNPPHHVKVKATKFDDGHVKAELEGRDFKGAVLAKAKEEKPTGLKGKLQDALGTVKGDDKVDEAEVKKDEPKVEAKKPEVKADEKPAKKETTRSSKAASAPKQKVLSEPKKAPAKKKSKPAAKTATKTTSKKKSSK